MIPNISQNLQSLINSSIEDYLKELATSFPCKVLSFSDGLVEIETLLPKSKNDIPIKIPTIQSPHFTLPIQAGDIGLALNCSFLFAPILENKQIDNPILSTQKNGLFFLPLLQKDKQNEPADITFKSAPELKSSLILNDESLNIVVAETTKGTIDGSTMTFNINDQAVTNLAEGELSLKLKGSDVLKMTDQNLSLSLGGSEALKISGQELSLNIGGSKAFGVSSSEISLSVGGMPSLKIDSSKISTPLSIEQSTPISITGATGGMRDFADYIVQLLDALSTGMQGTATNPSAYIALSATLKPLIKALFK